MQALASVNYDGVRCQVQSTGGREFASEVLAFYLVANQQ